jgi:hypothetical protein
VKSPEKKAAVNALKRLAAGCAIRNLHTRKVAQSLQGRPAKTLGDVEEVVAIGRSLDFSPGIAPYTQTTAGCTKEGGNYTYDQRRLISNANRPTEGWPVCSMNGNAED